MNRIYQIFNDLYIQQQAEQTRAKQTKNILDSTHKLKDFLDSLENIEPAYRGEASKAFCMVLLEYINSHPM